ncbi:hypothetical protein DESC_700121 [Desulfosarcina cetonica]|nr:hypothetical protein DESC_700121 [Desulfosarcina cetonica]
MESMQDVVCLKIGKFKAEMGIVKYRQSSFINYKNNWL